VKIWFQNRRAKERKQAKKREEMQKGQVEKAACAAHHQVQHMAAVGGVAM
jgi:homeobox protein CDX